MKTDERLKTLCEKFADLEEAEKDYILEVSQDLARVVSGKDGNTRKSTMPSPVEVTNKREYFI